MKWNRNARLDPSQVEDRRNATPAERAYASLSGSGYSARWAGYELWKMVHNAAKRRHAGGSDGRK